jgi:TPR repeat protein
MRRSPAALILIISLLTAVPTIAGQYEDAEKAYLRGDYKAAYGLFKPMAEQGLPKAQYNLGDMYDNGRGVPQNFAEAMKWYRKAADQGDAPAQYSLGALYYNSRGVPQDYAEAMKWYRKAADQGHAYAQFSLGLMYHHSQGVPQNYVEAAQWFRKAADQGYAPAQYNLGAMYYNGQGVPQDYVLAYMWFNLSTYRYPASEQGKREAVIKAINITASKMTPAHIAEAQKLAREWKPKLEK